MDRYRKLIGLIVVFGSIHFIATSAILPLVKWFMNHGLKDETLMLQAPYLLALIQYSFVIIWIPVSVWIYYDSKKDLFAPWLWTILILLANYQGIIIYLLIRLLIDKEKYTDEPMGKLKVVENFLPPPDRLVLKEGKSEDTKGV